GEARVTQSAREGLHPLSNDLQENRRVDERVGLLSTDGPIALQRTPFDSVHQACLDESRPEITDQTVPPFPPSMCGIGHPANASQGSDLEARCRQSLGQRCSDRCIAPML